MLVGRQRELALLVERLDEEQAVVVLGEAGVGKTTLVRAAAAQGGRRLVEGGALATLSWLPYLPLRRAFGRDFQGDAAYVGAAVEREVADALLFMDDLQWADQETTALIALLAGRVSLVAAVRRGDPGTSAALEAAGAAGLELIRLEPLPDTEAAALARSLHPELSATATTRLVERSGGNPFLLEELAATGEPSDSLRLALAARLRPLSPSGRKAVGLLALAGRPVPLQLLGDGAGDVVEAGLATVQGDTATIRHALLAETAAANLDVKERRRLHAQLARAVEDPGEAARHHASAGELKEAYEKALRAAEGRVHPIERAAHLALAASCSEGAVADELRVRAAKELVGSRESERMLELLSGISLEDPAAQAEVCLIRYRACRGLADDDGARTAWVEGMAAAAGSASVTEIELAIEEARIAIHLDRDFVRGRERAAAALRLARSRGVGVAAATSLVGVAAQFAGTRGWDQSLRKALAQARDEGDEMTELRSANMLASGLTIGGRPKEARAVAADYAQLSRERHLLGWERIFRVWTVDADWCLGELARAAEEAASLADEPLPLHERCGLLFSFANTLIDLGRLEEARRLVDELLEEVPSAGPVEPSLAARASEALSVLADLEYWSGRPRGALAAMHDSLERLGIEANIGGAPVFVQVTGAWAALDLGMTPGSPVIGAVRRSFEGAPVELEAIAALAAGENEVAASRFARAAALWRGRAARGEVRCLWGAGEAMRRAGRLEAAIAQLEEAERHALRYGNESVLGRIRRSLRLAGVRRSAPRTRAPSGLTGRETEVLKLVALGLNNAEIARRLALGRPTVERLLRSAELKLGATSRTQAAAVVASR